MDLGDKVVCMGVERLALVESGFLGQSIDGIITHPGVTIFTFTLLVGKLLALTL